MNPDVRSERDVAASAPEPAPKKPRRAYSPPTLVEYGTLAELTRKQASADAGTMSHVIQSFQAFVPTGADDANGPADRRS